MQYRDGWGIWALNGVRVPQALVETQADELDCTDWVVNQSNAEIRREAVRKIGVERVIQRLGGHSLDTHGDYELISLRLNGTRERPFLKMKNPSIGVWHVEGVAPHIKTVQQALNWRSGNEQEDWKPEVLT